MKLKSLDELKKIRERAANDTKLRANGENPDSIVIAVGMATCGIAAGARETMNELVSGLERIDKPVSVTATGCIGLCYAEPIVEVREPGKPVVRYGNVDKPRAREIIERHILRGELLDNAIVGGEAMT